MLVKFMYMYIYNKINMLQLQFFFFENYSFTNSEHASDKKKGKNIKSKNKRLF